MSAIADHRKIRKLDKKPVRHKTGGAIKTAQQPLYKNPHASSRQLVIDWSAKIVGMLREKQERELCEREQTFHRECERLAHILEQWKIKNKRLINLNATKVLADALVSSSGKICMQFFVTPKKEQFNAELETELTKLDQSVCNDSAFTIIRLVSFFI